jgi:hypothetical protein
VVGIDRPVVVMVVSVAHRACVHACDAGYARARVATSDADVELQEREILEGVHAEIRPTFKSIESAELDGHFPDTMIRLTAHRHGQTRTEEWPVWDGTMTGCPPGVPPGTEEYLTLLFASVAEWLSAPFWRRPPAAPPQEPTA